LKVDIHRMQSSNSLPAVKHTKFMIRLSFESRRVKFASHAAGAAKKS